jgi:hypothetical protein
MTDPRDYTIDVAGVSQSPANARSTSRPFLSVRFACCGVYQRIYRSADGASYQGRCPRCGKPVKFIIGDGGTEARAFIVY